MLAARSAAPIAATLSGRLRGVACRGAAWWAPALLLALPILLFRAGLGSGSPPFGGDVLVLDYPLLALIKRQLTLGLLPLWNNYAGGGYPLAPFSALILYPPLWGLRFLTLADQITVLDICHFALAGLGAYMLASITGAGRIGRAIGALSFMLSGFMIGHLYAGHLFELGVVGWMPWVFYATHRLIARPGLRPALLLGLLTGLQVLANGLGFLVFTFYPVAIVGLLALVGRVRAEGPAALRLLRWPALSAVTALGLAGAIVVPFVQVLGWSIRAGGLDFAGASKISLPPAALLMAFSPDALGNGPRDTYWLNQYTLGYWHEFALYVGLVPLLAAVCACLYCRERPWVGAYAGLAIIGLVLALGKYTPIYGLAFHFLPGLDLVRVPARWLLISTLAVAVLAGPGVEWLLAQRQGARALLLALRWPLTGAGALILALLIGIQVLTMRDGVLDLQPQFSVTVRPAAGRLLLFGGFLALLLACHADRLIRPAATAALLLAFTVLDLWVADSGLVRFLDPAPYYGATTVSGLLASDDNTYRVLTIDRSMPNRQGMVSGTLYDAEDFAPVTLRAYWSVTHPQALAANSEVSNADARDLITCYDTRAAHLVSIAVVTTGAPFTSDRLCVPHVRDPGLRFQAAVATQSWLLPNGRSWNPTPVWSITYVYRNPDALPRAFLVPASAAHPVSSAARQHDLVMRNSFNGRRALYVDPQPAGPAASLGFPQAAWSALRRPAAQALPASLPPGQARVLSDTGQSVQVAVNAEVPSYLVLDDAYYPGWQVWVDGHTATIARADYVLRAVRVSPGRHLLVFTYAPLSYLAGALLTVLTTLAVLIALAWGTMARGVRILKIRARDGARR